MKVAVGPTGAEGDPVALYGAMNLAFAPFPTPTDRGLETVAGGELVAVASSIAGNSNVLVRGASLLDQRGLREERRGGERCVPLQWRR